MDAAVEFGSRLRKLRKTNGFTQKELAEKTGIGQTAIANYESGKRFPDRIRLVRIADILETTTDSLLGRSGLTPRIENISKTGFRYTASGLGDRISEFMDKALSSGVNAREMILGLSDAGFTEEQIILDLLSPALAEAGNFWTTGRFNEAMEHQLSMTVVDSLMLLRFRSRQNIPTAGRAALLTATGEQHNIGIRMLSRFLEIEGWDCFFLGSSVPAASLKKYVAESGIDLVMISVTMNEYADSAISLISALKETGKPPFVMAGGSAVQRNRESLLAAGADFVGSDIGQTIAAAKKIRQVQ